LAWPSVKLFRPATGAFELFCPELLTALLFGPDCAAGVCAIALDAVTAAHTANTILKFISDFSQAGVNGSEQLTGSADVPKFRKEPLLPTPENAFAPDCGFSGAAEHSAGFADYLGLRIFRRREIAEGLSGLLIPK